MDPRLQRRVQRYGWDRASDHYERYWSVQLEPAQLRLLALADLEARERVLDTACGTGLVTFPAAGAVGVEGEVLGTDLSQEMVDTCRRLAAEGGIDHVRFERMNAETLAVEDDTFDVALCALGLMYVPDPLTAMEEAFRVLKPRGRAVAAVWGQRDRCGWAEIFPIVDSRVSSEVCPMFFQLGTGRSLGTTFETAGFRDVVTERLDTLLSYPSAEEALGAAFAGGPVALAYSRFDDETRAEAHAEYLDSIAPYREGEGYEIPGEFVVTRGSKA